MDEQHEVTRLLVAWRSGADGAEDELFAIVYEELRRIARHHLRRERAEHTFGATALVHEAYLRLVDQTRVEWVDRCQFYAVASRMMRRVLVDHARRHRAAKRDGALERLSLGAAPSASVVADERATNLLAIDDALARLGTQDERLVRVVECRFFAGLTESETSAVLGVTERTIQRDWAKAKQWLYAELRA
jgi:RNA polymerase sigma factor (TIGR02999 family)